MRNGSLLIKEPARLIDKRVRLPKERDLTYLSTYILIETSLVHIEKCLYLICTDDAERHPLASSLRETTSDNEADRLTGQGLGLIQFYSEIVF